MINDDAGGGVRGLRAEPSTELLDLVRHEYGINCSETAADSGGSSNLNLLVTDDSGGYVVRVYRKHVTAARLEAIHIAKQALAASALPVALAVPARDGRPWTVLGDRLVEVEHFVMSDAVMDTWERMEAGLPVLGQIHTALRDVEVGQAGKSPLFANYVEPRDALRMTLGGVRRIRAWEASPDANRLADAAEELAYRVQESQGELFAMLPRQLAHGDFWDNNVLFKDDRVVLVTDFDFMGERARIDDLALAMYFLISKSPGDRVSDQQILRLRDLVDAYDSGLTDRLSPGEQAALPLAIARQSLWSIGGWIALLDDEEAAKSHAAGMLVSVQRSLGIIRDLGKWQMAFA